MKTIIVSDDLHTWLMNHKNAKQNSADKVIYGLIGRVDELDKLEVFVWEGFNPDYTDGLAFAIAETKEEAKKLVLDGGCVFDWGDLTIMEKVDKCAFRVSGGG